MSKTIHFTYRGLAKEMGLKGFGKTTKDRLEKSILCLNECTIYSTLAIRDQEQGEYIVDFDGIESSRILKNYKSYNITKWKKANKKLLDPTKVEEFQSIEIDDFFFKNLCNNFLKLYDYSIYKQLKSSIAKKLQLILTQWSHGNEKYIKKALDELKGVKFIQDYNLINEGVNLVFNTTGLIKEKGLNKYTTDEEIICRLREIGVSYDDITKHCRLDTMGYVGALLRYVDYRHKKGYVDDIFKFTIKGLPYGVYDVEEFIVN